MTLVYLSTAWLIGIAASHLLRPLLPPSTSLRAGLVGLLAILPLAALLLWREDPKARRIAVCGLFLLLGALRYIVSLPGLNPPDHIPSYRDQGWTTVWGAVVAEPDERDAYTNLRLAVHRVEVDSEERLVKGAVLVRAARYPRYEYGDDLQVAGLLETPPAFESFSYRDYLARQGVYAILRRPQITLLSRDGGNPVRHILLASKGGRRPPSVVFCLSLKPRC